VKATLTKASGQDFLSLELHAAIYSAAEVLTTLSAEGTEGFDLVD
jgi:hypothetical protein